MTAVCQMFANNHGVDYYSKLTTFCASLECEIEGIKNGGKPIGAFKCTKDGSLRNGGWEYVTSQGMDREQLVNQFKSLHSALLFDPKCDPFHERTSTHVHVNVQSLEAEQVKTMVLLYALFEEFFFAMVKPNRRNNIHCVPLTETILPRYYNQSLVHLYEHWHKYTAFNLKRIADLGTIEFRHLHGTGNATEVNTWLHVLENLWKLCQRITVDTESLSDKKQIQDWFELIFYPADKVMMLKPSLFDIIRNSLIDVKFSTI